MNPKRAQLIQSLAEALIPLLGYLFWNWNFYFIALFYLLDLLANTVFLYAKLRKFRQAGHETKRVLAYSSFYILGLAAMTVLGILLSGRILENFDLQKQSIDFLMLKDMGLPQGILLLPLVAYGAFLHYKMKFLLPKRFQHGSPSDYLKTHALGITICVGALALAYGINFFVKIPEIVAVMGLIILTTSYSFLLNADLALRKS